MNNQANEEMEIDLLHLLKLLWSKAWIVVVSMVVAGALAFTGSALFITPLYKASAMMYVNNSSFKVGASSFSISTGELSAAKSLLDTYVVILKTRGTLETVIREADLDYTYEQLSEMVSAESVSGTEVFRITVTSPSGEEAARIVDTIVDVLPDRIAEIVDGSSVRVVDMAVVPAHRSSPSYTKNAVIGLLLGAVLSCGVIIVIDLLNTTIRDEDYLTEKYGLPILAAVPVMYGKKKGSYGSYYYKKPAADETNSEGVKTW